MFTACFHRRTPTPSDKTGFSPFISEGKVADRSE